MSCVNRVLALGSCSSLIALIPSSSSSLGESGMISLVKSEQEQIVKRPVIMLMVIGSRKFIAKKIYGGPLDLYSARIVYIRHNIHQSFLKLGIFCTGLAIKILIVI